VAVAAAAGERNWVEARFGTVLDGDLREDHFGAWLLIEMARCVLGRRDEMARLARDRSTSAAAAQVCLMRPDARARTLRSSSKIRGRSGRARRAMAARASSGGNRLYHPVPVQTRVHHLPGAVHHCSMASSAQGDLGVRRGRRRAMATVTSERSLGAGPDRRERGRRIRRTVAIAAAADQGLAIEARLGGAGRCHPGEPHQSARRSVQVPRRYQRCRHQVALLTEYRTGGAVAKQMRLMSTDATTGAARVAGKIQRGGR
jgi:hypothetical protein